jgi:hypothetical protein
MSRCALAAFRSSGRSCGRFDVVVVLTAMLALASLTGTGCRDSSAGGGGSDAGRDVAADVDTGRALADADCSTDGPGGGVCPINYCGYLKSTATLGLDETLQGGADSLCNQGRICLATVVTAAGDALALSCLAPAAGGLGFGDACSKDPAGGARCQDDSLCIEAADVPGAFCTTLCRIDADCPADAACLEYSHPLGTSSALVGQCTPKSKMAQTFCQSEGDCPAAQGCVRAGDRTLVMICKAGGTRSMGVACAAATECRSGECYDRDFRLGTSAIRAFCSGVCAKNSDCGPDQRCTAKVLGNNGTVNDPLDDVVVGYCRSLFAPTVAASCESNAACVAQGRGADTCDPTYGICYKTGAVIGGGCTTDDGCALGGACALGPIFNGGACVLDGCALGATAGNDLCPGPQSVCSQRASDQPLRRCYEGCVTAGGCSRAAQNYFCAPAKDGEPISICLSR